MTILRIQCAICGYEYKKLHLKSRRLIVVKVVPCKKCIDIGIDYAFKKIKEMS